MIICYLAPDGNDRWSGCLPAPNVDRTDGPCATLRRAQALVRAARSAHPHEAIDVVLRGGVYRIAETLVLGVEDAGTPDAPITWRNYPGETPVLTAAVPVHDWRRLDTPVAGLSDEAATHLWVADLAAQHAGIGTFSVLFDRNGLLPRACSVALSTVEGAEASTTTLPFRSGDLRAWPNIEDVEIVLYPNHAFVANILPLASVDEERQLATTALPGTFDLITHGGWPIIPKYYWVENVPEGLTAPGEWMVNTREGRLYLWPRDGETPGDDIAIPVLTEIIRIEGTARQWAQHLIIDGLTFTQGDRMRWPQERLAIQHDWDLYDFPNAMLRLRHAEQVTIRNCRFVDSGSHGVRLDGHAVDHRLIANEFARLGGGAIALIGDLPGNRDEHHHHEVAQNHIHHCAILWWHSSAIILAQSGQNVVRDNLIHHMPYNGITLVSGREGLFFDHPHDEGTNGYPVDWEAFGDSPRDWAHRSAFLTCRFNVIEHNEIHHVMERLADGNGIYVSGTGPGNVVRRNYVHDLEGPGCHSAIRLDDMQWYTQVCENVICRINGGGITLKDVNYIENNIIVDCFRWGSILVRRPPTWGSTIRRNLLVQTPATLGIAGRVPPFYDDGGFHGRLEEPIIDQNLLWCVESPAKALECLQTMRTLGKECQGLVADPQFVDMTHDDFRVCAGSPAHTIGFRPFAEWGIRHTPGPQLDIQAIM